MRRAVAGAACAALFAATGIATAESAWAHAEVESTSPRNGAVVATAPAQVDVRFSEAVELKSARLVGPDGLALASKSQMREATLQVVPQTPLPTGPITVSWAVVSDDGHAVSGAAAFIVGRVPRTGPVQSLTSFPRVPVTLTGSRPGQLSVRLALPGTGGQAQWTNSSVDGPLTWSLAPDGTAMAGRGVLPVPGAWTYTATVIKKGGAVVVIKGAARLTGGSR